MRFVKLVALGLGAALVSLTAMSSAGPNPNLTSVKAEAGQIVEGEYLLFTVQGTGSCVLQVSNIGPDQKEVIDDDGKFPHKLPTSELARQYAPGKYTLVVTTLADPQAPDCPAGQKVSVPYEVIKKPHCPAYWDQVDLDVHTGAITCVPFDPTWDMTCAGKTQSFFDDSQGVCRAGCQAIAF